MNSVTESFFDDKVTQLLAEVAKTNGFTNYEIKKLSGIIKGAGYMGILNRAKITEKENSSKVLNLIIKAAPQSEELRNLINIREIFKRETYVYDTVFRKFQEFVIAKKLPTQEFGPLFYGHLTEDKYETLVLQDLESVDHKLYEKRIPMTKDHLRLVLTQYGRFHAISCGFRDQRQEDWKDLAAGLDDVVMSKMLQSGFVQNLIQKCLNIRKALDENDTDLSRYDLFLEDIQPFLEGLVNNSDEHSVILHGDCWTNNMMFKYGDKTNLSKPTSVRFIDYQVSRIGSPVLDLSYFFYACCPEEALDNLDEYLQIYYKSFSYYLRQLGSDPDKLFPYTLLEEHWKKFSKHGLLLSVLVIHVMLTEPDETVDLSQISESESDISNMLSYEIKESDKYYERMKPIIKHFIDRKFL